ncbi:alpha/beta hydrolase [Pedobacter xixiisoli]|uniref:Esterase/lipase n=1 Tax=Pedobacter xixiisoli TaxID=1476464 RepID=A0A286A0K9_9SPHI|nr:alpha/beta fold hydrolase [Pedobacter xixiisoli]SOD15440.1 Esterase/lipase [Pedobacter xixiisoli]
MKTILRTLAILIALLGIIYLFGPKTQKAKYETSLPTVPALDSLTTHVKNQESKHKIKPNNQAEVIWADSSHQQTAYAVVYLHGFSASKEEGNPVHINFAKSIKANLYLARLSDHGIDTVAPMQYLTADRLWETAKEAFAVGKKLGKKVILVGTSTGGTLALQLAATYPEVHSLILLSPNIAINDDKVWLLTKPWGLQIAQAVSKSNERILDGKSPVYKKYWYDHYRLESVVQLQELLESSMTKTNFEKVKQPTLLLYYYKNEKEQDPVVKVSAMLSMFDELGTTVEKKEKHALPKTGNHVIGSAITSKDIPSVEKAIDQFAKKHIDY